MLDVRRIDLATMMWNPLARTSVPFGIVMALVFGVRYGAIGAILGLVSGVVFGLVMAAFLGGMHRAAGRTQVHAGLDSDGRTTRIRIRSSPRRASTLVDYGRNQANVDRVTALIQDAGRGSGAA